MRIIGITGPTGAGKSTVCNELKKRGAEIIDADRISREVSQKNGEAFDEIIECFGKDILKADGEIDRKKLGGIVFDDKDKLGMLNSITHKHIFIRMREQISASESNIVVLDVPLLFQPDFPFQCDLTVAVIAKPEVRIERIMERDGISCEQAMSRMKNQMSNAEYQALADRCFENDGDIKDIAEFVDSII